MLTLFLAHLTVMMEVTSQKTVFFLVTAVKNLKSYIALTG
jgi:hypothetical protein